MNAAASVTPHHPRETRRRRPRVLTRTMWVLALCSSLSAAPVSAQGTLQQARDLYLSADYEQALGVLHTLHGNTQAQQTEIATYEVFCLVALDRNEEATQVIDAIVAENPLYQPPDTIASPRLRTVFQNARRAALPAVVQRRYGTAKAAYDRKEPGSTAMFEEVLQLLKDPDLQTPAAADLRIVADGFRELSTEFAKPAPAAAAAAPASEGRSGAPAVPSMPPSAPTAPPVPQSRPDQAQVERLASREGDPGVTPPVAIAQPLPLWTPPARGFDRQLEFEGVVEILIDERGAVTSATIRKSIHPQYDAELLTAVRSWKFKPAMKGATPTPYAKLVQIRLKPAVP